MTSDSPRADDAMQRYARGEDAAFAEVFDAVAPRVQRFARRALHDDAAADDIVQRTLLRMHRARGDFQPGGRVLPWAYAIARNLIWDQLRQRRREEALRQRAETRITPTREAAPDAHLDADETVASLRAAFATLPSAQQTAFLLTHRDGMSLAEAARHLGTTIVAVKMRLHRAVTRLRKEHA
jgi:RNA polymerase sigma-70 factor (ECF subfamily)